MHCCHHIQPFNYPTKLPRVYPTYPTNSPTRYYTYTYATFVPTKQPALSKFDQIFVRPINNRFGKRDNLFTNCHAFDFIDIDMYLIYNAQKNISQSIKI